MEDSNKNRLEPARSQRALSWFLSARLLAVTLFLGGTILYQLRSGLEYASPVVSFLYLLVGLYYLQGLIVALSIKRVHRSHLFIHAQLVWDLLFSSALIYLTGGTESIFSFIFFLPIIGAGFLLGRKDTLFVASASAILYGSLLDLQYYGYLPVLGGISMPATVDGAQVFYAVFVHVVAFLLVGILSGTVAERLKKSEQALQRREIDYEELENLNKTILENIGSGLMIINPAGRIRSFNAAASRISGYRLEDVYDRPVNELFPKLDLYDGKLHVMPRAEGRFVDQEGGLRNLGYSTSLVKDLKGETLGLLMTFQDLTHLKEMEQKLQRADRLAAVGRLASGMAHEIRNPLASISGSVQLLMESGDPSTEDRQLMRIVVREADRLSVLLTDFLNFARPKPPSFDEVDVSGLLDELDRMVSTDKRFSHIELRRNYIPGIIMRVDRTQLRQALWNLLINAAEAIPERGVVEVDVDPEREMIAVHDSGPGIPKEDIEKIFDPFFTTRENGTGLGLATVYAIVENHGGDIQIGRSHLGGARFSIRLPNSRQ